MRRIRKYLLVSVALLFWVGAVAACVALAGLGAFQLYEGAALYALGARADGVVVRNDIVRCGEEGRGRCFRPVVRFTGPDDEPVEFRAAWKGSPKAYDEGARVGVLYRPDRPGDARIKSVTELFLAPVLFGVLSFFGIVLLFGLPLRLLRLHLPWKKGIEDAGGEGERDPTSDPTG